MTFHEDLYNAVQGDARRSGERNRLTLEARRARVARRPRTVRAAPVRRLAATPVTRLARLLFRRATA